MTEATLHFPTSTNITGVSSWFEFENQVSYAFSQTEVMSSFRELLRSKNQKFNWCETLDQLFEESKRVTVRNIEDGIKTFEINRTTRLSTDYSKNRNHLFSFSKTLAKRTQISLGNYFGQISLYRRHRILLCAGRRWSPGIFLWDIIMSDVYSGMSRFTSDC